MVLKFIKQHSTPKIMKELRIALIGSASTGKTTIAKLLRDNLELELHDEVETRIMKKLLKQR